MVRAVIEGAFDNTSRQRFVARMLRHLLVLLLLTMTALAETAPPVPSEFELARYEPLMRKSPFAPATPAGPAAPGFTQDLYVTGIARIGENDVVMIAKRGDPQANFSVSTGEPARNGIELVKVEWSREIGKSKVHLKKENEFGTVEFDQAAIQAPVQVTQQQMNGQQHILQPQMGAPQVPVIPPVPGQVQQEPQPGQQPLRPRRRIIRSGP